MNNPNNCERCDHKKYPDSGWCYMFRCEPTDVCIKHTAHKTPNSMFGECVPIIKVLAWPKLFA